MNTQKYENLFEPVAIGRIEIPTFLNELFRFFSDQDFRRIQNSEEALLDAIVKWYQGDYGTYAEEFDVSEWQSYFQLQAVMLEPYHGNNLGAQFITKGLMAVYNSRSDLRLAYPNPQSNLEDECGLIHWWLMSGSREYAFLKIEDKLVDQLFSVANVEQVNAKTEKIFEVIVSRRPDLFPLWQNRADFVLWWDSYGKEEYKFLRAKEKIKGPGVFKAPILDNYDPVQSIVNFVGYLEDQTGLGEDARMSCEIIRSLEYKVFPVVANSAARPVIALSDKAINFVSMPGADTYKSVVKFGKQLYRDKYTIGAWYWELPKWPKRFTAAFDVVNEIWAFSPYVVEMFKQSTQIPVKYAPATVNRPNIHLAESRTKFQLPLGRFLFLVMFDGKSSIYRKNPLGAVRAFYGAFSKTNKDVGLVIKCMHVDQQSPDWKQIQEMIADDERVHIIATELSSEDRFNLMYSCDAYVSAHRAEGFGRIIAECMLFEKPVLVSNYSGNLAFNRKDNAFLIDGKLVPVGKGEYWDYENQYWFDPDLDCLIENMRSCVDDEARRRSIAVNGRKYIETFHSTVVTTEAYRELLSGINV